MHLYYLAIISIKHKSLKAEPCCSRHIIMIAFRKTLTRQVQAVFYLRLFREKVQYGFTLQLFRAHNCLVLLSLYSFVYTL